MIEIQMEKITEANKIAAKKKRLISETEDNKRIQIIKKKLPFTNESMN